MDQVIVDLQERLAHQEAAIDEFTRQSLAQDERIAALIRRIDQLETQLRELSEQVGEAVEDAPPPHY
ncbi:SlyX family protein [endosymbiont of unidentified scaly snail isolate Monju]|uniref:SlyX family protein n=1 Tax=endosymbiont of unidentified scaly snail isolate Monju TaxID=1248727 RepID=UPI0003892907|nr:SlyX family protein [endosymbiont of unidentified scaly snail isolate Monju]BAN69693.1 SlyX protein [endosymbiont of unidentified scaly snail isolate Monju]